MPNPSFSRCIYADLVAGDAVDVASELIDLSDNELECLLIARGLNS